MPIYEYQCELCSCQFELKRSFNDNSAVTCPQCNAIARRVFSPVPIIFKGSGFYVTDHTAKNNNKFDRKRDGDRPADKDKRAETPKKETEPPKESEKKAAS